METLYELLVKHVSTQKLSQKQYLMYNDIFKKSHHPQFKMLNQLLSTFQKDENCIKDFALSIMESIEVFKNNSRLFYTTAEPIFHSKLKLRSVQSFVSHMMLLDDTAPILNGLTHLLVDYFNEQPYVDFEKDFPKAQVNQKAVAVMIRTLDNMLDQALEDEKAEMEFESKWQAAQACRDFLNSVSQKTIKISVLGELTI